MIDVFYIVGDITDIKEEKNPNEGDGKSSYETTLDEIEATSEETKFDTTQTDTHIKETTLLQFTKKDFLKSKKSK